MYSAAFSAFTYFAVLPITMFSSHSQSICVRPFGRMIGSPLPVMAPGAFRK